MRTRNLKKNLLACFAASAFLTNFALAQSVDVKTVKGAGAPSGSESHAQIQVPNRPSTALFQGQQGAQKTEIYFDPAIQLVTVKMLVGFEWLFHSQYTSR